MVRYKNKGNKCVPCSKISKDKSRTSNEKVLNEKSRLYYAENKDRILAQKKEYRGTEESKQNRQKYYKNNIDEFRKRDKAWKSENRETVNEQARARYKNNPEKQRVRGKIYRENNRDKIKAHNHRRRSLEMNAEGSFTAEEWNEMKMYYGNMCVCCERNDLPLSFDHVIPLAMGGTSYITNGQPLCRSCNSSKNIKVIDYRILGDRYRKQQNIE